ncbi:MAG: TetR/AcrR family transcriptional regulator [Candidatus Phaeomarinobacter sp.]
MPSDTLDALKSFDAQVKKPRTDIEARILQAASSIFGEKGFHDARTAEIARSAKTTERTLFKYFPSKANLFAAALMPAVVSMTVVEGLQQTRDLWSAQTPDFETWHDTLVRTRLEQSKKAAPQLRMLIATLCTDDEVRRWFVEAWRDQVWQAAVEALKRFQDDGKVRKDVSPQTAARLIVSVNLGYVLARFVLAPDHAFDDDAEIEANTLLMAECLAPRNGKTRKNS